MSDSGFNISELTETQQQVLLVSAFEVLQVASSSPMVGGDYNTGPIGAKSLHDDGSLLAELAKIPDLESKVNTAKQRVAKDDDAVGGMAAIEANGRIVFGGGVPVGGWSAISLFPNGAFNFSGHFHVSGAPSYNVGVTWVVTTNDGNPSFVLPARGRVHGTFEPGSRDFDWNQSGSNPALAAAWPELTAGYRWQWKAAVDIDFIQMGRTIVEAIGAVGTVVALL